MMKFRSIFLVLFVFGLALQSQAALLINEVQSSNISTVADMNGKYSDWIELYNSGPAAVNLAGYTLSDNLTKPAKWVFPEVSIGVNQRLLVFASQDTLTAGELHANFKISDGGEPILLSDPDGHIVDIVQVGALPADVSWERYPDGGANWFYSTSPSPRSANRASTASSIASPPVFSAKGGFYSIYPPSTGMDAHPWDHTSASNNAYFKSEVGSSVSPATGSSYYVSNGAYTHIKYVLATSASDDYSGYEMFVKPAVSLAGANQCVLKATIPQGKRFDIGFLQSDLNGRNRYRVVVTGTGVENDSYPISLQDPTGVLNLATITSFKMRAVDVGEMIVKLYDLHFFAQANAGGPLQVTLTAAAGDTIRYTTNGTTPTSSSTRYTTPLTMETTTFLRARVFNSNKLPSAVVSHSYFVNSKYNLPVVSIQMSDADLNGYETGIYATGPNAEGNDPHYGANYWMDWEKPMNFEFFESNGQQVLSQNAGISIFGGWSRAFDQKSFAIYSRATYGKENFDHAIFPNRPFTSYRNLVLRTGGNDWDQGLIRDAVMSGLVWNSNIDVQAWRPCVVLINGKNYGMYYIREKINEHYLANHYSIDPDDVDILEKQGTVVEGDSTHYMNMIQYIQTNGVALANHYDWVTQQMDVLNYAAYQAAEIYFANTDWPGNNIKFWKHTYPGNKWRWFLYDTDFGFDLWNGAKNNSASSDNIGWALNNTNTSEANSAKATFLFRSLMENTQFKNLFIVTMADFLNTYFLPDVVERHIDSLVAMVEPGLDYQWASTFKGGGGEYAFRDNVSAMKAFGRNRPGNVFTQLRSRFNLTSTTLSIQTVGTGSVKLTNHAFVKGTWTGTYFRDVPVTLTATPVDGHPFQGWSGGYSGSEPTITLPMSSATSVIATFGNDPSYRAPVLPPEVIVPNLPVVKNQNRSWIHAFWKNSSLVVELPRSGSFQWTILNAQGRILENRVEQGLAGENWINLPSRSSGILFIRIRQGNQLRTLKIPNI